MSNIECEDPLSEDDDFGLQRRRKTLWRTTSQRQQLRKRRLAPDRLRWPPQDGSASTHTRASAVSQTQTQTQSDMPSMGDAQATVDTATQTPTDSPNSCTFGSPSLDIDPAALEAMMVQVEASIQTSSQTQDQSPSRTAAQRVSPRKASPGKKRASSPPSSQHADSKRRKTVASAQSNAGDHNTRRQLDLPVRNHISQTKATSKSNTATTRAASTRTSSPVSATTTNRRTATTREHRNVSSQSAKQRRPQSQPRSPPKVRKESRGKLSQTRIDQRQKKELQRQKQTQVWLDWHRPTTSAELCVAPKKIKEIRSFLDEFRNDPTHTHARRLLILVGSPGIGKSTTIDVLANELNLDVCKWTEDFTAQTWSRGDNILTIETKTPLQSFEDFLQTAGAGYSSLALQLTTRGTSRTTVPTTAAAVGGGKKRQRIHSNNRRKTQQQQRQQRHQQKLILLEDWPNLHSPDSQQRFRDIMDRHVRTSQVPTVMIFSDVSEGKHRPEDLERLITPTTLYNSQVTCILRINPVTATKMKKLLQNIVRIRGHQHTLSTAFFESVHLQSHGDMRHAVLSLQLECTGEDHGRTSKACTRTSTTKERDTKLSTFHALGKVLYAKRKSKNELDFDPDRTLESSDMGLSGSLSFLEYHCVDMYKDIGDLSDAMSLYSDTAYLLDGGHNVGRNSSMADRMFPDGYVGSIAGRITASTNHHPAQSRFRQFGSPKIFDVYQKRKQNVVTIDQLFRRLSVQHHGDGGSGSDVQHHQSKQTLVTEVLPYARKIIPGDVNPSVEQLYSMVRSRRLDKAEAVNAAMMEERRLQRQQEEILDMDDIVEDEDSDPKDNNVRAQEKQVQNDPAIMQHRSLFSQPTRKQFQGKCDELKPLQKQKGSTRSGTDCVVEILD